MPGSASLKKNRKWIIFLRFISIFNYSGKKDFLFSYVILRPVKFMRDLDNLYSIQDKENIPDDMKEAAKHGILFEPILKAIIMARDAWKANANMGV